jgi:hypothetical protein
VTTPWPGEVWSRKGTPVTDHWSDSFTVLENVAGPEGEDDMWEVIHPDGTRAVFTESSILRSFEFSRHRDDFHAEDKDGSRFYVRPGSSDERNVVVHTGTGEPAVLHPEDIDGLIEWLSQHRQITGGTP